MGYLNVYAQLPYTLYTAELYCEFQNNWSLNLYFTNICERFMSLIVSKYILKIFIYV